MIKPILIFLCFITISLKGQTKLDIILREFASTNNDSVFVSANSKKAYKKFTVEQKYFDSFEKVDSLIFYSKNKGDILEVFYADNFQVYIKITKIDSLVKMRIGNIYLNPDKRGKEKNKKLASKILKTIKKTGGFDKMCKEYTDDSNSKYECDLGWFFQGVMVAEFEREVLKHKKDDCFMVETSYGLHIVKVLENPILDRSSVEYVLLYLKKE